MTTKLTKKRLRFLQELSQNRPCSIISIGRDIFFTNIGAYEARNFFLDNGLIEMEYLTKGREYATITIKGMQLLEDLI